MGKLGYVCKKIVHVKLALVLIKYSNRWCIILQESHITSKHVLMIPSGSNLIELCVQQTDSFVVQFKCTKLSTAKTNQISQLHSNSF